ncbi:Hypothetical predicted protein [Marmota monax]|uniref:Uncharacterized protein n=1 Tax=Marmota monax TaxID=9995 RepID=A0A5E4C291_MARMO|nr:hypothetical protein GHT09_013376 [Marmota monax]VTJ75915.1 Hypothetical predicted protein [Marmota monax]
MGAAESTFFRMNGRSCGMSLHRTSGTPQGPGMVSGQHIPPIRAHSGTPGPSSCGSTPSPAIGSLVNSLHLKMPSGGGMAPQNTLTESSIHLPALSPRRQVLTNGKPRFQVTQAGGMSGSHTLKPKQQEFGNPFSPNPGKAVPWLTGGSILQAMGDETGDWTAIYVSVRSARRKVVFGRRRIKKGGIF